MHFEPGSIHRAWAALICRVVVSDERDPPFAMDVTFKGPKTDVTAITAWLPPNGSRVQPADYRKLGCYLGSLGSVTPMQ
jgi:hypothetical protein